MAGFALGSMPFLGSLFQARDQRRLQKQALNEQRALQEQAIASANRQQRANEAELNRANQKQPDLAAILTGAQKAANAEPSTMLTGPKGLDPMKLKLQRPSLLGDV